MTIDEQLKLINAKLDVLISLCCNLTFRITLTEKILAANNSDTLFDRTHYDKINQHVRECLEKLTAPLNGRVNIEMVNTNITFEEAE